MTTLTEGSRTADLIIYEQNYHSRDEISVGAGVVTPGAVLGQITATKAYVALAPAATDGSQNAAAVAVYAADATAAPVAIAGLCRHATLNGLRLAWPPAITAPQKATALAALAAKGIVVR